MRGKAANDNENENLNKENNYQVLITVYLLVRLEHVTAATTMLVFHNYK